jgi:hypothetical protein
MASARPTDSIVSTSAIALTHLENPEANCPLTKDFKPKPLYAGKNPSFLQPTGKPRQQPIFTNFAPEPADKHRGEAPGEGRFGLCRVCGSPIAIPGLDAALCSNPSGTCGSSGWVTDPRWLAAHPPRAGKGGAA